MPGHSNFQDTRLSAEEPPAAPQRRVVEQPVVSNDRDCLSAALIQAYSKQTFSIQTWIDNIQLYRFPLAIAVVAVHAGEFVATLTKTRLSVGDSVIGFWFVDFLTMLSRLATPAFLLISGLIFFKDGKVSHDEYCRKVKSRCRTLLVPYLMWNFVAVLLLCAPATFQYFFFPTETERYTPLTLTGVAKWMLGWPVYPADGPLWFVRDLLLLIALVPILNFVPRRALVLGLGTLFLYWLLFPLDVIPGGIPRAFSVLFFTVGAALGMNPGWLQIVAKTKWLIYASAAVLLFSAAGGAICNALGADYSRVGSFLQKGVRISGALLIVCAATRRLLPARLSVQLHRLSPAAFFLFASHYLVLIGITPLFTEVTPKYWSQGHEVLLFGLISSAMIGVSLVFYFVLKRYAPSLLGILDGNRSAPVPVHGLQGRQVEFKLAASWNQSQTRPEVAQ